MFSRVENTQAGRFCALCPRACGHPRLCLAVEVAPLGRRRQMTYNLDLDLASGALNDGRSPEHHRRRCCPECNTRLRVYCRHELRLAQVSPRPGSQGARRTDDAEPCQSRRPPRHDERHALRSTILSCGNRNARSSIPPRVEDASSRLGVGPPKSIDLVSPWPSWRVQRSRFDTRSATAEPPSASALVGPLRPCFGEIERSARLWSSGHPSGRGLILADVSACPGLLRTDPSRIPVCVA